MPPHEITEPIRQFRDDSLCGHCCVAMAANVRLCWAIQAIGHRRGTHGTELEKALAKLGVRSHRVRLKADEALPTHAILGVKSKAEPDWHGHWILKWGDEVHDPSFWPERSWPIYPADAFYSMAVVIDV